MEELLIQNPWISWLVMLWTLPWKGFALWKSAHLNHKIWFVILFLLNTLGILEILYIFIFSRKEIIERLKKIRG